MIRSGARTSLCTKGERWAFNGAFSPPKSGFFILPILVSLHVYIDLSQSAVTECRKADNLSDLAAAQKLS